MIDFDIVPYDQLLDIKKYKFEKDQTKKLLARSFLFNYLKLKYQISDFELKYNQYQKPLLNINESIDFSISYSGDYILIAVSDRYNIGVDIEFIDNKINHIDLKNMIMHQNEISYYNQLIKEDDKLDFFFKAFNIKESIIKSLGMGLYFDVTNINILDLDNFTNPTNQKYFLDTDLFSQLKKYKTCISLIEK